MWNWNGKTNLKISYSRLLAKNKSQDLLFKIISKKTNLKISYSKLLAKNESQDFLFKIISKVQIYFHSKT